MYISDCNIHYKNVLLIISDITVVLRSLTKLNYLLKTVLAKLSDWSQPNGPSMFNLIQVHLPTLQFTQVRHLFLSIFNYNYIARSVQTKCFLVFFLRNSILFHLIINLECALHYRYLDIYISQKIRLCKGGFEPSTYRPYPSLFWARNLVDMLEL